MPLNDRFKKKPDLMGFNFGRLAEDIMGVVMGARSDGRDRIKTEIERLLQRFDFVTRREFDAVRAIAIAARTQAEELAEQVNGKKPAARKAATAKTPAKKATIKKTAVKKPAARTIKKAARR